MVGAFPPPVHGMSQVNAWMRDALRQRHVPVVVIDLAATGRGWRARLVRLLRVIGGLTGFLRRAAFGPLGIIYLSVSGGWGQVYDIIFVSIARICGIKPVLHHHSYAYLTTRRSLAAVLMQVAGRGATHVVLCSDMERRLRGQYNCQAATLIVSNARLVECHGEERRQRCRRSVDTIGYLGNIAEDKGIGEFLAVAANLAEAGHGIQAVVAGPFLEPRVEGWVRNAVSALDGVSYVGPTYGDAKADFFSHIDVLVFPTKYLNEAEPLAVLEGMAHGVPAIAWGRGCLMEMIADGAGLVIDVKRDFVSHATTQIQQWASASDAFALASESALRKFRERADASTHAYEQLLHMLGA